MEQQPKPGWYWQEGLHPGQTRYWDGQRWTDALTSPPSQMGSMEVAKGIFIAVAVLVALLLVVLSITDALGR
jgi:hypothetical protein